MNSRYLEDDDIDEIPRDREISLGAPTLLGLFFLLALVCAVFFGFGYSFGRKSSSAAIASVSSDSVEASSIKATGAAKPAAGEITSSIPAPDPEDSSSSTAESTPIEQPAVVTPPPAKQIAAKPAAVKPAAVTVPAPKPAATTLRQVVATQQVTQPVAQQPVAQQGPQVPSIVQVAAVSHQEDADVLLNALKHRGYNVTARREPQDKLLHIQIGPLASRKDADAMRQRLLTDGYKAIIK